MPVLYGVREPMLLRQLVEVEGLSKSAAVREIGINRSTLRHWVLAGRLDTELDEIKARYGPRPRVPTKLEPFKPLVQTRLAEFPLLTARRLLAACRAAGYVGSYTQLTDYVRTLRPTPVADPTVRFET